MERDCGCINGTVGIINNGIVGSIGLYASDVAGSVGVYDSDIAGCIGIADYMMEGSAGVIHNDIIGKVGIICTPSTELFIRVTPEMVWLTADMLESVEFEVVSNTTWEIE